MGTSLNNSLFLLALNKFLVVLTLILSFQRSRVRNSNYSMSDTSSDYDAECAIWLCLPTKFKASECAKAHKALVKRPAKLKLL